MNINSLKKIITGFVLISIIGGCSSSKKAPETSKPTTYGDESNAISDLDRSHHTNESEYGSTKKQKKSDRTKTKSKKTTKSAYPGEK